MYSFHTHTCTYTCCCEAAVPYALRFAHLHPHVILGMHRVHTHTHTHIQHRLPSSCSLVHPDTCTPSTRAFIRTPMSLGKKMQAHTCAHTFTPAHTPALPDLWAPSPSVSGQSWHPGIWAINSAQLEHTYVPLAVSRYQRLAHPTGSPRGGLSPLRVIWDHTVY